MQRGHLILLSHLLVDGKGTLHRLINLTMADSPTEDGTDSFHHDDILYLDAMYLSRRYNIIYSYVHMDVRHILL